LIRIWLRKGEILLARKEKCGHDDWLPWLEAHTAQRYMRIFKKRDRIPDLPKASRVTHLSKYLLGMTDILLIIQEDDPAIRKAMMEESLETGKSVRALEQERKERTRKPVVAPEPEPVSKSPACEPDPVGAEVSPALVLDVFKTFVLDSAEEDLELKKDCEKYGRPYDPPFSLVISRPMWAAHWVDGFATFLDALNAAHLSEKHREYVTMQIERQLTIAEVAELLQKNHRSSNTWPAEKSFQDLKWAAPGDLIRPT
jgi:hypothetical protein